MASAALPPSIIIATLGRLRPLPPDRYIMTLGQGSDQFLGTPNGYSATYLPPRLFQAVGAGRGLVKKITWASHGSRPESWFFVWEPEDGTTHFMVGPDVPSALKSFIQTIQDSEYLRSGLRVQLGAADSFVAWSGTVWACANIPIQLQAKLQEGSSATREGNGIINGELRVARTLDNVQWNANGSYYIKSGDRHLWNFEAKLMSIEWNKLWKGLEGDERMRKINEELAYVFISPHAEKGETFVFIKKHSVGLDAPFVVGFEREAIHTNLEHTSNTSTPSSSRSSTVKDNESDGNELPAPAFEQRVQHIPGKPEEPVPFQWATVKKSGRPHKADNWEVELRKGDKVKVIRDEGRDWFVAIDRKGFKGYVHGSWIEFGDRTMHKDPKAVYIQFQQDLQTLLTPVQLQQFPAMSSYVDECTRPECQPLKESVSVSSLGICFHDLLALLQGSGKYSYEWLKETRNLWHPDRFARFCHPDHVEGLKLKAEQMFVMYGILMDATKA
ncbi:hypothetical protein J4E86_005404 [Alternaria arbusti]|uniref:uncharacterized protein n=1 Tax=Alternaria arbusti TaxID=232088 RepID=UPI00221EB3B4|nr:uncharacterized protein J4E86_005404 [Alternaria arbusti]KAI4956932.1 hypothetical protein J4E86_005404 [Alternaria arbusti]